MVEAVDVKVLVPLDSAHVVVLSFEVPVPVGVSVDVSAPGVNIWSSVPVH